MERRLLTLLAETPVHAGGPESLAAVDLPIQREAATGLPVIWGQSLKGALRQAWRDAKLPDEQAAFGSRPPGSAEEAGAGNAGVAGDAGGSLTKGAISVGDAQLVLFPAATLRQVFGWVTTPLLLSRLGRKLRLLGTDPDPALQVAITGGHGLGAPGWEGSQVIGPFVENIQASDEAARIGAILAQLVCPTGGAFDFTRRKLSADVLLVEDSTIAGLARMGTDVVARVQLEEKAKKVAHGPFYSEHLPAETVLAALLAGAGDHLDRLAGLLDGRPVQLGGDETIGKGVLWCRVHSASPVVATSAAPTGRPAPSPTSARPSPAAMRGRKHG
ncbi:MAG: type III-B CRISPR module RAMP protein Cmr4 [Pseudonocardiaceae bacterium]